MGAAGDLTDGRMAFPAQFRPTRFGASSGALCGFPSAWEAVEGPQEIPKTCATILYSALVGSFGSVSVRFGSVSVRLGSVSVLFGLMSVLFGSVPVRN